MLRLVSHCHTHHSFDSSLPIRKIIDEANSANIKALIINDHDVFSLTDAELVLFKENGIIVFSAIEFTTREGVHVIGVHHDISTVQASPYGYGVIELLSSLKKLGAKIIFPHPYHATGIYGNKNISRDVFEKCIRYADGFEINNYRYGITPLIVLDKIKEISPNAILLIGSDAHCSYEIASFINEYDIPESIEVNDMLNFIFNMQPEHIYAKKRHFVYFLFKRVQKTFFYQEMLNLVSSETRKKIKKIVRIG